MDKKDSTRVYGRNIDVDATEAMSEKHYYQLDTFIQEYDGETPVVIFGTGDYGQFIFDKLTAAKIRVDCFTCNSKSRYGSTYCNVEVRAPSSIIKNDTFVIIAVVAAHNKRDVLYQLLDSGVRRERIVIPIEPVGGLFSDSKLKEVPEFAEIEKMMTLTNIKKGKQYFCDYFLTNELARLALLGEDELVYVVEDLLSGTNIEVEHIGLDSEICGFDAVLLTDRENFIFLEEQLMDKMGEAQIPVIDFWSVVKKV